MATSTAAASRSPQARSFQIKTIAMQRARPTMISPVRNSGRSGRKVQARVNMNAGPTIQFRSSDRMRSEEHTSELQSRGHLVCRLLLEKKKKTSKLRTRSHEHA